MNDTEIRETAQMLLLLHDDDAPLAAAMQADDLAAAGDRRGCDAWMRVLASVQHLQCTMPPISDTVH